MRPRLLRRSRAGADRVSEAGQEPDLLAASADDLRAWRDRIVSEAVERARDSDMPAAISTLKKLESATIDQETLDSTDPLLGQIAGTRRVIASLDPTRVPGPDEVVIVYGNYPHVFDNVVVNNPVKRHVADFWKFEHDDVEYDRRWDGVDRILIINADGRADRWDSVLRELASAGAPLQRITRVSATEPPSGETDEAALTLACLHSHTEALRIASDAKLGSALVLEDDFSFTSDLEAHLTDLQTFFERGYGYWVCLIATSKYGAVVPVDDLVAQSFQECTNAAGYIVSADGRAELIPLFETAAKRLQETGDTIANAADRCWSALQPSGKFLVFRRKFGFQGASFSDIYRSVSRYLD